MLVLSRKKDEAIAIGKDVIITVVEVIGHKVRLGISAPKETPVFRTELLDLDALKEIGQAAGHVFAHERTPPNGNPGDQ